LQIVTNRTQLSTSTKITLEIGKQEQHNFLDSLS
jgi:hypothetical protein